MKRRHWRPAGTVLVCLLSLRVAAVGQGYICAIGGGSEDYNSWSDAPYRWIVQRADSQHIIVLATSTQTTWIPTYFMSLGASSSTNYIVPSVAVANDSATYHAIRQSRGVFIKGGDQWLYVSRWRGTLAEQAIREVFLSGGVVAGTSAGAMVLSEIVSDAQFGTAVSRSALRNPRSANLSLTTDFLQLVPNTLIDTHFHERGRFGRLLASVGKYFVDTGRRIIGIGIEDLTALCISPNGSAEVMGSGSVNFYYPSTNSTVRATSNEPLVFTNVQFDALVAGFAYNLNTRTVSYIPPTATAPLPGTSDPAVNSISLFGDAFPSPDGLTQFTQAAGGTTSRVAVVCLPGSSSAGQRYVDSLMGRGIVNASLVLLDQASANNATMAGTVAQSQGIIFTSNLSETFPSYTDSTTLVGQALRARLQSGIAVAYAHQDAKLAGSRIVFRTELEEFAAYRGKLILGNGMKALRNLLVMPLIFESSVYDENRSTGLTWGMAKSECKTGIYLDEGGYVTISPSGLVQSIGPTPVVLVDARNATHVDFSTYRAPSSVGPRQSAAIVGGKIQVLDGDVRYNALTGQVITSVQEDHNEIPVRRTLVDSYPNPFNPTTTIRYSLPLNVHDRARAFHVRLTVYDVLGRELATLVNAVQEPGQKSVHFDIRIAGMPSGLASGVLFYRLSVSSSDRVGNNAVVVGKMLLLR